MIAATRPVRHRVGAIGAADRPVALPHLESDGDGIRFLGEPVDPALLGPAELPLWRACDGSRELASWRDSERATIRGWHATGLLVAAPGPAPAAGFAPGRAPAAGPAPAGVGAAAGLTVVSPHPDDAQLALGGLLAARGGRVVDVFSEETWTRRPYYAARPALAARLLLAEELVACQVLGVTVDLLGHTDGAARPAWRDGFFATDPAAADPAGAGPAAGDPVTTGPAAGDPVTTEPAAGDPVAAEPELFATLVDGLRAALPNTGPVLIPLGVGGHVDHLLAREAVLALVGAGAVDAGRIGFYEDMPYSLFADPAALARRLGERTGVGRWDGPGALRPLVLPATTALVKREALWAYRLQVTEGIITRVLRYGQRCAAGADFAERVWLPEKSALVEPLMDVG